MTNVLLIALFFMEIFSLSRVSKIMKSKIYRFLINRVKNEKMRTYIFSLILLPGTFIHELSHFLSALFLLVPVRDINLIPQNKGGSITMGSVPIGKTDPIRRLLVGVSPVYLGIFIIVSTTYLIYTRNLFEVWYVSLGYAYLLFQTGNSMFASKKDLEGAWIVLGIFAFTLITLFVFGFRLPPATLSLLSGENITRLLIIIDSAMLVPVVIDLTLIMLVNTSKKIVKKQK